MGLMPYEEYFPRIMELEQLEKVYLALFETYQELMCYFYICLDVHNAQGIANGMKVWTDYLFSVLDEVLEEVQFSISDEDIARVMAANRHEDVVLDEDYDIYEKSDRFKSFHHQASQPMSRKALLADFLMV